MTAARAGGAVVMTAAALACAGGAAAEGSIRAHAAATPSRSQQIATMHKQEVTAFQAGVGGITMESGYPTGAHLVATITSDQPYLRGIVVNTLIGSRGHIGVGQTTSTRFIAVGHTADGAVVRYSAVPPRGL
jgi:hypothetical protein